MKFTNKLLYIIITAIIFFIISASHLININKKIYAQAPTPFCTCFIDLINGGCNVVENWCASLLPQCTEGCGCNCVTPTPTRFCQCIELPGYPCPFFSISCGRGLH